LNSSLAMPIPLGQISLFPSLAVPKRRECVRNQRAQCEHSPVVFLVLKWEQSKNISPYCWFFSSPVVRASIGSDHGPGPADDVNARTLKRYNEPGIKSPMSARVLGLTLSRVPWFHSSIPVSSYSYWLILPFRSMYSGGSQPNANLVSLRWIYYCHCHTYLIVPLPLLTPTGYPTFADDELSLGHNFRID
jgi:hypothetical protein